MIKIISDGSPFNTYFYDEEGKELTALRNACMSVRFEHVAGDLPRAVIDVLASVELVLPKGVEIVRHPLDEMAARDQK